MEFPDGTKQRIRYGSDYEIRNWVGEHPEHSEVIDGNNPKFWEIVDKLPEREQENIKGWEENLKHWGNKGDKNMVEWAQKHLDEITKGERWTIEHHFWNITENRFGADAKKIKEEPTKWYLVNVDLHT